MLRTGRPAFKYSFFKRAMFSNWALRFGLRGPIVFFFNAFRLRYLCLRSNWETGMVQKHPFSGNTRDLSADPDRSRVGAGLRESLAAVLGLQFRENRVYPRSSSQ